MSNDEQFVKIDYLTLEDGDLVYQWDGDSYERIGVVTEISDKYVFISNSITTETYTLTGIEQFYTLNKNFYCSPSEKCVADPQNGHLNKTFPKKVLTNEEIYEMLTSDVALLGLSKKAVRKIEKAVLAKVYKGESK